MSDAMNVDLCVIGGGSGGLSVAAGASQMGASVVLVEGHKMGGDCLNYGCVPSKALLSAARAARDARAAARLGVDADPRVDFPRVMAHVKGVIAGIAPHDSVERFEGLGVTVIQAMARFVGPREVEAGGRRIRARRVVVATGSRPFVPPIPGVDDVPYLTNETVFDLEALPEHLVVVGGGPIGCELAQAFRRLGAAVTVVEMATIMPNDDSEAVAVVREALAGEGIDVREGAKVTGLSGGAGKVTVAFEQDGQATSVTGSHVLMAVGRRPNVANLNLEAAGIEYSPRGIQVDSALRTSDSKVFAIGDVAGGLQFTHVAGFHAGVVIKKALFRMPFARADKAAVPWVTYTDPELAHVGLNESQARERAGEIRILRWPLAENDRARAEGETDGFAKAVTDRRGRILGATIVGRHAGELIQPWVLALDKRMKIEALATSIAAYPTLGEVSKRAAGSYYTATLFSERTRKIVRFLARFG